MADKNLERRSSIVSLAPFIDPNRLLRVGGRLQQLIETIEVKDPLLLPPDHRFTELLVSDCHRRTLHGGLQDTLTQVRERFWILRARQLAKKVINKCNGCRWARLKPANAPTAPLPQDRIIQANPFEVVGIDFAGPLMVKTAASDDCTFHLCGDESHTPRACLQPIDRSVHHGLPALYCSTGLTQRR